MNEGPRILLIDHDEEMLFSMWQYLIDSGCRPDCARSLDEAETFWHRHGYQIIITDLRLRGITENEGLKLVDYIRARCPAAKIMLLTHYGSPHIEAEARRRGVVGFLYPGRPAAADLEPSVQPEGWAS